MRKNATSFLYLPLFEVVCIKPIKIVLFKKKKKIKLLKRDYLSTIIVYGVCRAWVEDESVSIYEMTQIPVTEMRDGSLCR